MNLLGWILVIKVVSGGAMGGAISYEEVKYPSQIACESAAKQVIVKQTAQLAGSQITHTFLAYCKPVIK